MTQLVHPFPFGRDATREKRQEIAELHQALNHTSASLHQVYQAFNYTCERELIESYVYEINALHSRYNYLLRRIKETEERP